MLTHPTLDQLNQLGLFGMAKAFDEVAASGDAAALPHLDWLALLLDREMTYRQQKADGQASICEASPPSGCRGC
jgi:hypothetical protein